MAEKSVTASRPRRFGIGRILTWLLAVACFGVVALLVLRIAMQFVVPAPLSRLQLLQEVQLPGIAISQNGQPLSQSIHNDRFDFQALDPQTGLLFSAHDGPSANKLPFTLAELPAGTVIRPSIVVFDTRQNKYVASINGPNVHGIAVAPNIQKVYAAGFNDSLIYVIDERACQAAIQAGQNTCSVLKQIKASQNPDGLEYDPDHHEVFVSEPGSATPSNGVIDVIDTQTDSIIKTIKIGVDVGHIRYDSTLKRVFVVSVTPTSSGAFSGALVSIDPLTRIVTAHIPLPSACNIAHGMAIDESQQVAFVACIDSRNVAMVDLQAGKAIGDPNHLLPLAFKADIVAIDRNLHVLFVGCNTAISVFDESKASSGVLTKYGDYVVSANNSSHSIAVDESTHNIYVPITDAGSRPAMAIEHYDPNGTA